MMKPMCVAVAAMMGVSACADTKPISVERAMALCKERAYKALKPDVRVGVGIGGGGHVRTGVGITLSSDYIQGRDPEEIYETCVVAKSGEEPTQPLEL